MNTVIVVMSVVAVEAVGLSMQTTNLVLLSLTLVAIVMSFVWGCAAPTGWARAGR